MMDFQTIQQTIEKRLATAKARGEIKYYDVEINGNNIDAYVGYARGWDVMLNFDGKEFSVFENLERKDTEGIEIPALENFGEGQGAQAIYLYTKRVKKAVESLLEGNWASGRRTKLFYV